MKTFRCLLFVGLMVGFINTQAQVSLSPYTAYGIGDVRATAHTHKLGMGGLGISNGNWRYLNNINPALLPENNLTIFEAGMTIESRKLSSSELSESTTSGSVNYIALGIPVISNKWTFSFGVNPYSTVNYNFTSQGTVEGSDPAIPTTIEYVGNGGLSEAFISNGYRINKYLSVGATMSYMFGSIIDETVVEIGENVFANFTTATYDRTNFSDVVFSGGIAAKAPLKKDLFLNLGIIFDAGGDINAKRLNRFERRIVNTGTPVTQDTLVNNVKGSITLPSGYGFGISLEKPYNWTIGADLSFKKWSDFRNFSNESEGLVDNVIFVFGGEFTPDATSVDKYFKRVTYRLGARFEQTPYELSGEQINDFGINFGFSLPVSRASSLNLALQVGKRGTTDNSLVEENYIKAYFGVTFNDKWFIRRKYD